MESRKYNWEKDERRGEAMEGVYGLGKTRSSLARAEEKFLTRAQVMSLLDVYQNVTSSQVKKE